MGTLDGISDAPETPPLLSFDFGDLLDEAGTIDEISTAGEQEPDETFDFGDLLDEAGSLDGISNADELAPNGQFDFGDLLDEFGSIEKCVPALDPNGLVILVLVLLAGGGLVAVRQSRPDHLGWS